MADLDLSNLPPLIQRITQRMAELSAAESRLETRLALVARLDESLRTLAESLRKQVAEAYPLLDQLKQSKTFAADAVAQVVDESRQGVRDWIMGARNALAEQMEEITARAAQIETRCNEQLAGMEKAWLKWGHRQTSEIRQQMEKAGEDLEQALRARAAEVSSEAHRDLDQVRNAARELVREMDLKHQELRDSAAQFGAAVEEMLKAAVADLETRTQAVVAPLRRDLETQATRCEQLVEVLVEATQRKLAQRVAAAEKRIADAQDRIRSQFCELAAEAERCAASRIIETRQQMLAQIQEITGRMKLDLEPLVAQIRHECDATREQARSHVDAARQEMNQRMEELRRVRETIVQDVEDTLAQRIRDLGPRAAEAIEQAEKNLSQRLGRMLAGIRHSSELHEEQIAQRLETLRPRAAAIASAVEADVSARLAKLEEQAQTMTAWLVGRLNQRIDETVQRSRRVLREELAAHEQSPVKPPVEIELYLDATGQKVA